MTNYESIVIAWEDQSKIQNTGPDSDIFYKYVKPTALTSLTQAIYTESNRFSHPPDLVIDANNFVHISWYDCTYYNGA